MKITDLLTIEDLERAARLDPPTDPAALALAHESFNRIKPFAPLMLAFAEKLKQEHPALDSREIASAMFSMLVVIDAALQLKTGEKNEIN